MFIEGDGHKALIKTVSYSTVQSLQVMFNGMHNYRILLEMHKVFFLSVSYLENDCSICIPYLRMFLHKTQCLQSSKCSQHTNFYFTKLGV